MYRAGFGEAEQVPRSGCTINLPIMGSVPVKDALANAQVSGGGRSDRYRNDAVCRRGCSSDSRRELRPRVGGRYSRLDIRFLGATPSELIIHGSFRPQSPRAPERNAPTDADGAAVRLPQDSPATRRWIPGVFSHPNDHPGRSVLIPRGVGAGALVGVFTD